jgi:hypothetical protein
VGGLLLAALWEIEECSRGLSLVTFPPNAEEMVCRKGGLNVWAEETLLRSTTCPQVLSQTNRQAEKQCSFSSYTRPPASRLAVLLLASCASFSCSSLLDGMGSLAAAGVVAFPHFSCAMIALNK